MAEAINEASGRLQTARIKVATGEAKGKIAYNYYAEQLYDPRCHVIQVLAVNGKPLATLVNYAIHPEVETKVSVTVARSADEAERINRGEDISTRQEDQDAAAEAIAAAGEFFDPEAQHDEAAPAPEATEK